MELEPIRFDPILASHGAPGQPRREDAPPRIPLAVGLEGGDGLAPVALPEDGAFDEEAAVGEQVGRPVGEGADPFGVEVDLETGTLLGFGGADRAPATDRD